MSWPFRVTDPLLDVLEVLVDADSIMHGWAIMKETRRSGPTVYQVLERLRKARWVECWWEDETPRAEVEAVAPGGSEADPPQRENVPRRRYYRLSDEGAARAPALLTERGRRRRVPSAKRLPGMVTFRHFRVFAEGGLS